MPKLSSIVLLGRIAHDSTLKALGLKAAAAPFAHGAVHGAGNIRLYSRADIQLVRRAQRLIDELGVNLAGVDVILRMSRRISELERRLAEAEHRLGRTPPQIAAPIEEGETI